MNADVLIHPRATNAELFRITRAGYKVVREQGKKWAARGVPVTPLSSRLGRVIHKLMPWGAV